MSNKDDARRALLAAKNGLKKKWGNEVFRDTNSSKKMPSVSTGSPSLDRSIGIGGLPYGRIVEIFGPESCGKTSLVSIICGNAQRADPNRFVAFVDVEHAFNGRYASELGMNVDPEKDVAFTQPESGEEALDIVLSLVESGSCSVVVLDSVGGIQTKRQIEGDVGKDTMGEVARLMSQTIPKISKAANKTNTLVLFINQERSSMAMYGPSSVTMGGKALPYFSSVRLRMRKSDIIMEGNAPIGQKVEIKVVKNKVGNPFGVVETSLYFHTGFDKQAELVDEAIKAGVVDKGGAWYYLNKGTEEELRFQGKNAVVEYYRTSPEAYENMLERLLASEDGIVIQVEPEDPANETLEEDFSE